MLRTALKQTPINASTKYVGEECDALQQKTKNEGKKILRYEKLVDVCGGTECIRYAGRRAINQPRIIYTPIISCFSISGTIYHRRTNG